MGGQEVWLDTPNNLLGTLALIIITLDFAWVYSQAFAQVDTWAFAPACTWVQNEEVGPHEAPPL